MVRHRHKKIREENGSTVAVISLHEHEIEGGPEGSWVDIRLPPSIWGSRRLTATTTSGPLAPLSLPAGQVRDFRRRDSEEVVTHLVPNSCHAGSPWNARGAPKALRNGDRCVRHHGQTSLFSFIGNAMGSARARRF